MNFFKALIGTCSGTRVFIDLVRNSPVKALWHLIVMVTLSSLFILLCTYSGVSGNIDAAFEELEKTFGKITIGKNGIRPANFAKEKSLVLSDNSFRVSYLPSTEKDKLPDIDADDINYGFLWTPSMLTSWFKTGRDKFLLVPYAYYANGMLAAKSLKRSEIMPYIKNNSSLDHQFICQFSNLTWESLKDYSKNTIASVIFLGNIIGIIFQVLFFVLMFSLIMNLSNKNVGKPLLKYSQRFVVGIYASMPPIIIATMFQAFELPFFSFNSVYVISFSIYLIVVFTRLQLDLNPLIQNKSK